MHALKAAFQRLIHRALEDRIKIALHNQHPIRSPVLNQSESTENVPFQQICSTVVQRRGIPT